MHGVGIVNIRQLRRTAAVVAAVVCCCVAVADAQKAKPPKPPGGDPFNCWFEGAALVEFGYYDPFNPVDLRIQSQFTYRCSATDTPPSRSARNRPSGRAQPQRYPIEISFSTGLGGDYNPRTMTGTGTDRLEYNLYRDAACTQIWGDGTRGTSTLAGDLGSSEGTFTAFVYGMMPAGQNVTGGAFFDVIVMTIDF